EGLRDGRGPARNRGSVPTGPLAAGFLLLHPGNVQDHDCSHLDAQRRRWPLSRSPQRDPGKAKLLPRAKWGSEGEEARQWTTVDGTTSTSLVENKSLSWLGRSFNAALTPTPRPRLPSKKSILPPQTR